MNSGIATRLICTLCLAPLLVSCSRPAEQRTAGSASSTAALGTSGIVEPLVSQDGGTERADIAVERDPNAIKALEAMGNYLRSLKTFQIRSETSRDKVLQDGQNVEFDGVVDMIIERPNKLRAEVTSARQQRMYFSDGKTFSVWARRVNYYGAIPAPPTLRELADMLSDRYNLELPVADLFYWGERRSTDQIVGATDLGPSPVDDTTCEHYAFRQDGLDWQVWIQQGDYPLPRKLVIRTTTDPARPRFSSVMTWNLAPSYNDAAFTFVPPKDAKRITLAETQPPVSNGTGQ